MESVLDNSKLRQLKSEDLADYFRLLLENNSEDSISTLIFAAIERESVPPDVATIWLSIVSSPTTILIALKQDFSALAREEAIKLFVKSLNEDSWQGFWDGIGGTKSLLSLLSQFSVADVKFFFSKLLRTINGPAREKQRRHFSQLLQGLFPLIYPDAPFKSTDERPLLQHYQLLLPICDSKFLDGILRDKDHPLFNVAWGIPRACSHFLRLQYKILRQQCLDKIFETGRSFIDIPTYFGPLLQNSPGHPSAETRYSESMLFSLAALREFAGHPNVTVPGFSVLNELINRLIGRSVKKHHDWKESREIVDLSVKYLSQRPGETNQLTVHRHGFVSSCIKLWAYKPEHRDECEGRLISILRMVPSNNNRDLREFEAIVHRIPKPLRYRLLRILFLNTGEKPVDIDEVEDLQTGKITNWSKNLFQMLTRGDAISLLHRLMTVSGDRFLSSEYGNTIIRLSPTQSHVGANPSMLLNLLEQGKPELLERASVAVEEHKKNSYKSREQTDRAYYANSALFQAISSGSLELYGDTLIWARRFVKDPLTVKSIFSVATMNTTEGVRLLSGIPYHVDQAPGLGKSSIALRVKNGNKIILDTFETVCSAFKEPSFHKYDWNGPLRLLSDVILERFDLSQSLQLALDLSDDELYDLLWPDTLALAIRIEKIALSDGHEALLLRDPSGLISSSKFSQLTSSFRFIDKLAQNRDDLWRVFRLTIYPAVAALPSPLPRGLPIQCLNYPFNVSLETANGMTPFISSRAKGVVFAKSGEALSPIPDEDETQLAIGGFVDSFSEALKIYVLQGNSSSEERQLRATEAWDYALQHLSGRMTQDEAQRTWRREFVRVLPHTIKIPIFETAVPVPELDLEHLLFPSDADIGEYSEWNPADAFKPPPPIKRRQLHPLTYLDSSITSYGRPRLGEKFVETVFQTEGYNPPGPEAPSLWSVWKAACKKSNIPTGREGLTMFALLFLEHYIPNHKSILRKPFPSEDDVRYPDVWLDISFADIDRIKASNDASALSILEGYVSTLPPSLLYKLTKSAFNALAKLPADEPPALVARAERLAFGFLSLLAKCDQASLAIDFILKVIIDRPDSSSWHRNLLTISFMRSLSPTQAKNLIRSFAEAISQKVKDQDEYFKQKIKPETGKEAVAPKLFIKITTMKYLAQLVGGGDFIPESFGVEILGKLFDTSSHIDVRVAIVESLMGMLQDCDDTDYSALLGNKILEVLESTIPIAGRTNERYLVEKKEWEIANRTGKLPDVFEKGTDTVCLAPILSAIMDRRFVREKWQKKLIARIIVPILEKSITNNGDWLEIFTRNHGWDLKTLDIPILPVKLRFLRMIVASHCDKISSSIMELYQKFIVFNMSPSPKVSALNQKLREDPKLRDLQDSKHWLSLYGHGPGAYNYDDFNLISILLSTPLSSKQEQNIPISQIQDYVFKQAELLLSMSLPSQWQDFMHKFGQGGTVKVVAEPLGHAKLVVQRIIALIDSQRTPAWQKDQNRQPAVLPETLTYRLWLLPYPVTDSHTQRFDDFVKGLRGFVSEICRNGNAYHEDLFLIKTAALRVQNDQKAEVACMLGEFQSDKLRLADLLCLELARDLLLKAASTPKNKAVFRRAKKMVESWCNSPFESVRRKGVEVSLIGVLAEK